MYDDGEVVRLRAQWVAIYIVSTRWSLTTATTLHDTTILSYFIRTHKTIKTDYPASKRGKMQMSFGTQPATQKSSEQSRSHLIISSTANLQITMSFNVETKPQRQSHRYRPIQRDDGVIVLQRPYQPPALRKVSAKQPTAPKFEKHIPVFIHPSSNSNKERKGSPSEMSERYSSHLGAQFREQGRDGYNAPVDTGRGGYNNVLDMSRLDDLLQHERNFQGLTPMTRFLEEDGPWTVWS